MATTKRHVQRGSEMVTAEDTNTRAHHETKDKWAAVPRALAYLAEYTQHLSDRVRNKEVLTPVQAVQLMDILFTLKEALADGIKSPLEKTYDLLRFVVIPELMDDQGLTGMVVEGIGRVNLQDDVAVSVAEENRPAFYAWLNENELEDMIKQTVNAQTLAAFVRRRLKEKDPEKAKLPVELLKITPFTRVVITR